MNKLDDLLETLDEFSTVMIACRSPLYRTDLSEKLAGAGINILGPVDTATYALTIAAQTPADVAIVEAELAGRRNGAELAQALERTWGVRSVLIEAPEG